MSRWLIALVLLASCDRKSAPSGTPASQKKMDASQADKPKDKEPEPENKPFIAEGSPFSAEDLTALQFPKDASVGLMGMPEQHKYQVSAPNHAILLYCEWGDKSAEGAEQALSKQYALAVQKDGGSGGYENRYGEKSYIAKLEVNRKDDVPLRKVEIGFKKGDIVALVATGNSDQEVLEKDLERVARGAAEKLAAKLK